jgi:hypothetical protein
VQLIKAFQQHIQRELLNENVHEFCIPASCISGSDWKIKKGAIAVDKTDERQLIDEIYSLGKSKQHSSTLKLGLKSLFK